MRPPLWFVLASTGERRSTRIPAGLPPATRIRSSSFHVRPLSVRVA
jgi:hypothetical protein